MSSTSAIAVFNAAQGAYTDQRSGMSAELVGRIWRCRGVTWKLKARDTNCIVVSDFNAGPANGAEIRLCRGGDGVVESLLFVLGPAMQVRWHKVTQGTEARAGTTRGPSRTKTRPPPVPDSARGPSTSRGGTENQSRASGNTTARLVQKEASLYQILGMKSDATGPELKKAFLLGSGLSFGTRCKKVHSISRNRRLG